MRPRGDRAAAATPPSPAADLALLQGIIGKSEPGLTAHAAAFVSDVGKLEASRKANRRPVLAQLEAIEHTLKNEARQLDRAKLTTAEGRNARKLAVETLETTAGGVAALRSSFATASAGAARRHADRSRKLIDRGSALEARASQALGFTWQL
ncbi:MAG TPA: hypothetical protein VL977_01055 [Solirubrobacteraceae bacterium]|nr:hypothetical protein [Solirubrobacteraceae bacterium]